MYVSQAVYPCDWTTEDDFGGYSIEIAMNNISCSGYRKSVVQPEVGDKRSP